MLAKLIVRAATREAAVAGLAAALGRFEIGGVSTNLPLLRAIAMHPDFCGNRLGTRWLEQACLPGFFGSRANT
jgi:acetyl/propionyl-CoA carboxylase alpha subunit